MKSFILLFQLSLLITWSECLKFHVPIGRRTFMQSTLASSGVATVANAATTLPEEFRQGTLGAGNSDEGPVPKENYKKMSSGIVYADLKKGRSSDKVVEEGSRVNIQWLPRKANGYFVDSSEVGSWLVGWWKPFLPLFLFLHHKPSNPVSLICRCLGASLSYSPSVTAVLSIALTPASAGCPRVRRGGSYAQYRQHTSRALRTVPRARSR